MNNLRRRIDRLEDKVGVKPESRITLITNVCNREDQSESPYEIEFVPGLWAHAVRGGPFSEEEIRGLREKYAGTHRG